jgi:hypothetical protein
MRKFAFVVVALVACLFSALRSNGQEAAPPLSDEQAFTEFAAKIYEETTPGVKARVVAPLWLKIHTGRGDFQAYLNTAYATCQRHGSDCEDFMRRQIKAMATAFTAAPSTPTTAELRVTVRPSSYVDEIAAVSRGKSAPIAEPLVGDLWVIGVRDEPTTIATLSQSELDTLKLDAAGALTVGKRNVEARLGAIVRPGFSQVEPGDGVVGLSGDDYLASLLALPDLWTPLAERFDGQLYVAAPASDYVIFADARAEGNLARMAREAAVRARAAKRPLSTDVFEWTPTGWEVVDLAKAK